MNRAILEACLPALIALAVAFVALAACVRFSGARFRWRRVKRLHRCQDGGVQSLAFVITLPIFVTIVLFILQVSQLMVGMMVVNYAAFAAARAAIVWLPAQIEGELLTEADNQNRLRILSHYEENDSILVEPDPNSGKYQRIRTAAVLACAPVAPSRDLGIGVGAISQSAQLSAAAAKNVYASMSPESLSNPRISQRLDNKIAYSDLNTDVLLEWRDARNGNGRNTFVSPTYNPREHANTAIVWRPYEVGWQDAVTVYVVHRYALFPGPGQWLAQRLVWTDSFPARIRARIQLDQPNQGLDEQEISTVLIPASATITNEGFKSIGPFIHVSN